jgi:hypothetical protein
MGCLRLRFIRAASDPTLSPSAASLRLTRDKDWANPLVDVEITIDRIPPTELPYSRVYGFLQTVASLVTSTEKPKYSHTPDGATEYENALSDIRAAITEHMWGMHDNDNWFSELQLRLSGTPDHYYHLLQHGLNQERPIAAAGARGV